MSAPVSVIIPALNEEENIGETIDAAFAAGASEVIVADGGSRDATCDVARARGARVLSGESIRARQLNQGADAATHEVVLFVHADTLLPPGAAEAAVAALDDGFVLGGFRIAFREPGLQRVAVMINLRTRLTRQPWGDQAQFTRRSALRAAGGFPDVPIMEDYELARRMKRAGRTTLLPLAVRTSGRRFVRKGVLRTAALNWLIIASYHLGVSPVRLARWYRE